jgi:adenylate cyclase
MVEDSVRRKLRAILSADVKGYSRMMGEDEIGTYQSLTANLESIRPIISEHKGRVFSSPGDAVMAEFSSVVAAVQCAVELQDKIEAANAEVPEDRKMQFRIGVNLGDVIHDGEQVYGDGVNIAARIETLAEPGKVSISRNVYSQVRNKLKFGYEYQGEHQVKNIAEPLSVYKVLTAPEHAGQLIGEPKAPKRLSKQSYISIFAILALVAVAAIWQFYPRAPEIEPALEEKMAYPLPDKPSIAVLPFDNMSEDPKQDYFCDGLTENIITALSKTTKMFVIARNSTFTYKGKAVNVNQIAEELGVQYVLEGGVRKEGDHVRITAQLIDALTGHHLWAEKYDREFKEIFSLQDEITKKIISSLEVELTEGEQAYVYAKGTDNLEAYLKATKANWLLQNGTKDGVLKALDLAEEAIDLDSNYAFAYKVLGTANGVMLWLQMSKNPRETLKRTIELHRRSVELNDSLAIAHAGLGYWLMFVRQHDKAVAEGERAYILEPGSADTIHVYAAILTYAGKRKEAIPLFEEALRLNPKPPTLYLRHYGVALRDSGLYKEANAQAERAIKNEPDDLIAWVLLVSSLSQSGREEEARAAAKEVVRINPKFSVARIQKLTPHKDRAVAKRFGDSLRKAGLPD